MYIFFYQFCQFRTFPVTIRTFLTSSEMTYFSCNNFSSSNYAFVAFLDDRRSTNFCNASNQQHRCELRSHFPPAALVASKTIAINFMRQKCNSSLFHHLSKMQIICALPFWSPMSKSSEEFSYSTPIFSYHQFPHFS